MHADLEPAGAVSMPMRDHGRGRSPATTVEIRFEPRAAGGRRRPPLARVRDHARELELALGPDTSSVSVGGDLRPVELASGPSSS